MSKELESIGLYKKLIEFSSDAIIMVDKLGRFAFVNKKTLEVTGYKEKELIGKGFKKLVPAKHLPKAIAMLRKVRRGLGIKPFEIEVRTKGGVLIPFEMNGLAVKDKGKNIGVQVIARDITERKKAEEILRKSDEKYKIIFEGTADGILVADTKSHRFIFANPRICEITGYSLKELLKLGVGDIHPKKDLPFVIDRFTKQAQKKITLARNIPVLRKDKKVVYCDVNSKPVTIDGQEYLVGFFRDISERRKTEEKIKYEKEFSETILNIMPVGLDIVDKDCIIRFMNKTFLDVFGKKALGKKCYDVYKINKKQCDGCSLKKPIKIGETKTIEVGSIVGNKTFLISHTGILFNGKKHILEVFRDITEIKKSEEVLRKSHEELEKFYKVAVGRELKMIELKKRIRELESPNSGNQGERRT
ncbi:MAG: PAS domain-containing protein [Candidatus Aenigmatarchaeota archaeon]